MAGNKRANTNTNCSEKRITKGKVDKNAFVQNVGVAAGRTLRSRKPNPRYTFNETDRSRMENRATKKRNCKVQPPNEDCVDNTQRDANVKEKSPSTVIVQTSQENASAKVQNLEEMRNCERENINDLHHQDLSAKKRKVRDIKKNFSIDCIASSQFIDVVDLCGYLTSNIKVDGEKNNFRKRVSVKAKTTKVCVKSSVLKKKDVKYWTNKFLKAKKLRALVRVISSGKFSYKLTLTKH